MSGLPPTAIRWLFLVGGIFSLLFAVIFFGAFAMSGGSDCAVSVHKCAAISDALGFASLFFVALAAFSIWKVFWSKRPSKSHEAAE